MGKETERKYLVNKEIWNNSFNGNKHIFRQGYMLAEPKKTIRVRLTDTTGFITIKGLLVGASRAEYEYQISKEDAEDLLNRFCDAVVTKVRHKVLHKDKLWEVDEFSGDNEGLIIAELELSDENEKFELPDWIDKEVTGDKKYYNWSLSINPYKNWK